MQKFDVIIVGAGVVGCAIARELSRYRLRIAVLEKEVEIGQGTSKGNTGLIHSGVNADPATLSGRLNLEANPLFDQLTDELAVPFDRNGSLVLAFSSEDRQALLNSLEEARTNGVQGVRWLNREQLLEKEKTVNPEALGAIYAPRGGIICPFEFTLALAQNAAGNGVVFRTGCRVHKTITEEGRVVGVETDQGFFQGDYLVNAAGLSADEMNCVREEGIRIKARRGQYLVYDRVYPVQVKHTLFPRPTPVSKGIIVTPTVHGNLMIGPDAEEIEDKSSLETTREGISRVIVGAKKLVPALDTSDIIRMFSGNRAVAGDDFIIRPARRTRGLILAAGIQSPGLTTAPRIAGLIKEILQDLGLNMEEKDDFQARRPVPVRPGTMDYKERAELISRDSDYGQIICRCEGITRGEIREAIRAPLGARTIDGIKRRTQAASGRCQSGFCGPRLLELLQEYAGIDPLQASLRGGSSQLLKYHSKELLLKAGEGLADI